MEKSMKHGETWYIDILKDILEFGDKVDTERTGVGTTVLTNQTIEHSDVDAAFPILISKKVPFKIMAGELLWFLEGSTSDARLAEITFGDSNHDTIWTANYNAPAWQNKPSHDYPGKKSRPLGPIYGRQWRCFGGHIDQIVDLIDRIKTNPSDRRLIVTAWNPKDVDSCALPPCHIMFQVNIINGNLDLCWFQRSMDAFLGGPFNMASYALLMKILAKETGYKARKLTGFIGNAHIYNNHLDQANTLIDRFEKDRNLRGMIRGYQAGLSGAMPRVHINNTSSLFNPDGSIGLTVDSFELSNYNPHSAIKAQMAV
jgi:thymidylate synthase